MIIRSEDRDSGHNSEDDGLSRESERPTEFFIEDVVSVPTVGRGVDQNGDSNV